MMQAAEGLEFEKAAALRDRIMQLKEQTGTKLANAKVTPYQPRGRRGKKKGTKGKVPRPRKPA